VQRIFLFSKTSRPALWPTRTSIKGALLDLYNRRSVRLTTHPPSSAKIKKEWRSTTTTHTPLWREQGRFTSTSFEIFNGVTSRVEKRTARFGIRSCIAQK
jgi:hypothetical protein